MQEIKTVKLGEVCIINPTRKSMLEDDEPVSFLAMADVSEDGTISNEQQKSYGSVKKGFTYFEQGDVLIAKITPCFENGKGALTNCISHGTGFGSTEFHVIRPTSAIDAQYVFYLTRTPEFRAQGKKNMTGSAGQQRVPANFLQTYPVPLPDLDMQSHIAAVLDKADALRQKDRQLLACYEQLPQAVFLEMFGDPVRNEKGWDYKSIRSLSNFITDGPFGSNLKTEHYKPEGVRVIRLNNIGVGEFLDEDKAYVSEQHYRKVLLKNTCLPGDVVIGTLGDPNLRACIVPDYVPIAINKADCVLCKPNPTMTTAKYLTAVLNNPGALVLASSFMRGQTRLRISMGQLATLKVPVPPLALQTEFAQTVEAIEKQKAVVKQQLASSEALFQSLLHDFFGRKA